MSRDSSFDVVVVGAGAAGMMCAATAGQRGRRVLLIDHYPKLGEKIRISGGGRCNFTNINSHHANYLSQNPDFCRSALARYTPQHFIELVRRHGIAFHEKKLGQLFCDESSQQIIDMLQAECDAGNVEWRMPCAVQSVVRDEDGFVLATSAGRLRTSSLVIATGGLTVPRIGATPFGYQIAEQFGLTVVPPRPALVPLAFAPDALARYGDLSGVSLDAEVRCNEASFRESLLFTHRGLSGPAILQISSYWDGRTPLSVDLLPDVDARAWFVEERSSSARFDTVLADRWPRRFAQQWSHAHQAAKPMREIGERTLRELADSLHDWRVLPSGTLGYQKAEVTLGGVDTRWLSSKTMAAILPADVPPPRTAPASLSGSQSDASDRDIPAPCSLGGGQGEGSPSNVFFIGECVDVTGWLGGYNFQWAWASGHAAGEAV